MGNERAVGRMRGDGWRWGGRGNELWKGWMIKMWIERIGTEGKNDSKLDTKEAADNYR